jgi:RHS repeat-associated protein
MMHAITHLNPVIGVDIHIIQPPGPVPPLPIPHPYIGIVFDPADYIPIIGSTISIHGLPRAIAGTAGKSVPSHIPIGGTFVKPPGNEDEDFMGSSTVAFDGDAATYMGLPVLSCQDVGMIPPPRTNPKKKTKVKSMVLPLSVVLPIPAGPPVLIGGPPTISLMALGMRIGIAGLGRGLRRLARTNLARRAGAAFRRMRQRLFRNMRPGFLKCRVLRAEPVDVVTGEVVVDQQDFSIPGRIPIEWNRHYGSRSERMGVCGYGWETPADARLEFDYDGTVIFHDGTGAPSYFESLPVDGPVMEPVDGGTLHQIDDYYAVRLKGGLTYYFPIPKEPVEEVVVEYVMDLCKNYLRYVRDENGLREIVESADRRIEVTSENGLIKGMRLLHPEYEKPHPLVRFEYSQDGDLITVFDDLEHLYIFRYQNHRLIQHTNRNGLSFYYEYDEYSPDGRCHRTGGDGGLYNYHFKFHDLEGGTEVTDSLGHTTSVKYNSRYQIIQEVDALGGITQYEYDPVGRTSAVVDSGGLRTEYEYDDRGNVLKVIRPDGATIVSEFDKQNQAITIIDPNGNAWRQEWDSRGLLLQQISPIGAVTKYRYDDNGSLNTVTDPLGAVTRLKSDRYGNTISITDALGHKTHFSFNPFGNVISKINQLGIKTLYNYDKKSRLTAIVFASGTKIECSYDHEDNLTLYRDRGGYVTRLEYGGLNELVKRRSPDGASVAYHYDTEERLIGVTNQRGEKYNLVRDPLGRTIEIIDFWGQSRKYQYDSSSRLLEMRDALGFITKYQTDPLGRVMSKLLPDGTKEDFKYDLNGNLIFTSNTHIEVTRSFDEEGRLLEERQGDFRVTNTYDLNGNRVSRKTSHGNTVGYEYNPLGQVVAIIINDSAPIKVERNAVGQVITETLAPNLRRTYRYSSDGLIIHQEVTAAHSPIVTCQYEYDQRGNLVRRVDWKYGIDAFRYDPMERVIEHSTPEGRIRQYLYDSTGDLLRCHSNGEDKANSWERVADYKGITYRFDAAGNLIDRQDGDLRIKLEWDANNRLIRSQKIGGDTTNYGYDAQGRRIFKETRNKRTHFYWDGDALLGERFANSSARELIYYPQTFEPLAIIGPTKEIYYYHNDPNGLPNELIDVAGYVVWSGSYTVQGKVDHLRVSNVSNPLRLQGQYFDAETALQYNRNRYYDSYIGSFISQDPIGLEAGENPYLFASNIWRWVDPLGLTCRKGAPGEIVRRFDTRKNIKNAKKNGIPFDPKKGQGIPTATTNIDPVDPDAIRELTGARAADEYVDIDISGKDVVETRTKAGNIEIRVQEDIRPEDILGSGRVRRSRYGMED